jgi:carbon-monoxide dehydrogenase medium subunit
LALGGEILAYGPTGTRVIDAEEFFVGHLRTDLRPEEIVTGLRLEVAQSRQGSSFRELARRSGAEAIAGVAAHVTLSPERPSAT